MGTRTAATAGAHRLPSMSANGLGQAGNRGGFSMLRNDSGDDLRERIETRPIGTCLRGTFNWKIRDGFLPRQEMFVEWCICGY